tara:strand:+ start:896 stop:1753 length:858 start_codon:yes stop_codon:yes gene_type:complete
MKKRVIVDSDGEELLFEEASPKRAKTKKSSCLEDEYACPITQELFIDPVTAEDGRVYEREAITQMFKVCNEQATTIRSPITNQPMGSQLFQAHQVKSTLLLLIAENLITGERVDAWNETMKRMEENRCALANLKKSAEAGNAQAMYDLGRAFRKGEYGLKKDETDGFLWYKRASDLGHASAMCAVGQSHVMGRGVGTINVSLGMAIVFASAWRGSEHACSEIARWFNYGLNNLPQDLYEARFYYVKMQQAEIKDSGAKVRERASSFLNSWDALELPDTRPLSGVN